MKGDEAGLSHEIVVAVTKTTHVHFAIGRDGVGEDAPFASVKTRERPSRLVEVPDVSFAGRSVHIGEAFPHAHGLEGARLVFRDSPGAYFNAVVSEVPIQRS